jgi:hypothetical protein
VDLLNFFLMQLVGEGDLDTLQTNIEVAIARAVSLGLLAGGAPITGLAPTPNGTTLVLPVAAGVGVALDASGNPRIVRLVSPGTINCGVDLNSVSTIPSVNPRWITVLLKFVRNAFQDEVDGANVTIQYHQDESSVLQVIAGAEAGSPTKPAIPADCVCIADFYLQPGVTALTTARMDLSRTRATWAKNTGGLAQQLQDLAATQLDNCRPFVVEAQAANAMKVGVRPGTFNLSDQLVTVAAGQTVTVPASPSGGKHRITLIYIDSGGMLAQAHGAEVVYAAQAVVPSFEGRFPVATYDVLDTTTALLPASLVDVRPFQRMARDVPNRYSFVAVGGETVITPGFAFVPGSHGLEVYDNGVLVDESAYTEAADGLSITLGVAAVAGHRITLRAPRQAGTNPVVAHASTHAAGGADAIDYSSVDGLVHALEMYSDVDEVQYTVARFCGVIDGKLRSLAAPVTRNPGGIAADAFLYVYAYWTGSAVAIAESVTPPNADRRTISIASLGIGVGATAAYLGTIRTTIAGNNKVRAFRRVGRRTTYLGDLTLTSTMAADGTVNNVLAFSQTGDMVLHTVGLSQAVPPHVKFAELAFDLTGAANQNVLVQGKGPAAAIRTKARLWQNGPDTQPEYKRVHVDLNGSQQLDITASANGLVVRGYVVGYED